jgi:hypothetical protein
MTGQIFGASQFATTRPAVEETDKSNDPRRSPEFKKPLWHSGFPISTPSKKADNRRRSPPENPSQNGDREDIMARTAKKLNVNKIKQLIEPGRYNDGDGLFVTITKSGVRSWLFRYQLRGKERWMGLGPQTEPPFL